MSAPTDDTSWATDDDYAAGSDPWDGTATKVEPSSGRKASGFEPNQKPTAQEMNWWMHAVYLWIAYIGDFLANLFTTAHEWTDTQTFDVPPVAPDYYTSASRTKVLGVGLAHRNVTGDNYSPGGAPPYVNFQGPELVYDGGTGAIVGYTFFNNTKPVAWDIPLDVGDQITGYGAYVHKGSNASQTLYCKLVKIDSAGSISDGDSANVTASNATNAPGDFLLSPALAPVVAVATATARYQLLVYTSGTYDAEDTVFHVAYDYKRPVP
jgi:hypothetical protein